MYLLIFNVPESHLEPVKQSIFAAGAGSYGQYSHCSWQTQGEGQYKPLAGSNPYLGEINQLTKVKEYKVETVCAKEIIKEVIAALKASHPYEVPSYQILELVDL